jgi:hypothetical protein
MFALSGVSKCHHNNLVDPADLEFVVLQEMRRIHKGPNVGARGETGFSPALLVVAHEGKVLLNHDF